MNKILYVCDRKACTPCVNHDCMLTSNIEHAVNFELVHGTYIETPSVVEDMIMRKEETPNE